MGGGGGGGWGAAEARGEQGRGWQRTDKVLGEAGSKAIRLGWMEEEHPQRRMITVEDYRSLAAKLRERQPIYPSNPCLRVSVFARAVFGPTQHDACVHRGMLCALTGLGWPHTAPLRLAMRAPCPRSLLQSIGGLMGGNACRLSHFVALLLGKVRFGHSHSSLCMATSVVVHYKSYNSATAIAITLAADKVAAVKRSEAEGAARSPGAAQLLGTQLR